LRRRFALWSPALRRAIAAALIVVIAAGAAAATIAIYERRHQVPVIPLPLGPVTRGCASAGIHMFDPQDGWNGTSRTHDGGKTWRDASPPPVTGSIKGPGSVCALDNLYAWSLTSIGTVPYQPTQLVVMATHDGGQSWFRAGAVTVPYSVSWRIGFAADVDFLDKSHGWLWMEYSTTPQKQTVYATSDGGATWERVGALPDLGLGNMAFDCSETGLMFDTTRRGWLTWDCTHGFDSAPALGTPLMAITNDGGRTWSPVALDGMPATTDYICGVTSPIFTRDQGVLQVSCAGTGHPGWDAVYSTDDGGSTWQVHPLAVWPTVDFISGTTGFYLWRNPKGGPNTLYRTDDGGAHWVVVASDVLPGRDLSQLTFLTDKVGFVNAGDSPAPWWTYDGGKTWALPPPYRSAAGGTVCAVFADPGAQSRLPMGVQMTSPTVGWAPGTRRTVDGGAHWAKVAPPAPPYRSTGYGEFFLDAMHAWVVDTAGTKTQCADHVVIYATSDGGATWQQLSSLPVPEISDADSLAGTWGVGVEFVDPQDGWLVAQAHHFTISTAETAPVFRTTDGGRTWNLFAANASWSTGDCAATGLPTFTSPTSGWIASMCSGTLRSSWNLLVTQDGGETWTNVELKKNACTAPAYPDGCPGQGPTPEVIDGTHGWLLDGDAQSLLTTSDGGLHWSRHGLPSGSTYTCQGKYGPTTCTSEYVLNAAFLTPSQGWILSETITPNGPPSKVHIERTLDGGRTWSVIYTRGLPGFVDFTGSLTFVDANHGFWWIDSDSTLYVTADGGRSWQQVHMTYS